MNKIALSLVLTGGALAAHAQSISSFVYVDSISGVNTSLTGLNLNLSVNSAPTFTWNSVTYQIERVWGVWALDDNDDLDGATAAIGAWNPNKNLAGTGGIIGWKTQTPNDGLLANQSVNLTYGTLSGTVEDFGYHIRVFGSLPGGSNTMHIRQNPVPEPASLATLGLGLAALARRRRGLRS